MPLTDTAIRNAAPRDKMYRLSDGNSLYLEVYPHGAKLWRVRLKQRGKETLLSLGPYPTVTLKEARQKRDVIKVQKASGLNPSEIRKEQTRASKQTEKSFTAIYNEWLKKHEPPIWSRKYYDKTVIRAEKHILPVIGGMSMAEITPPVVLDKVLRPIEARGIHDTAHRVKGICSAVFQYAIASGQATYNPTYGLERAITSAKVTHYAAITTPLEIGKLLLSIDCYHGSAVVHCALRLMPLVFLRTQELRMGVWSEVSFDDAEWRIPADRMKMDNMHIVPLSRQSLSVLRDLYSMTGHGEQMFPGATRGSQYMSDNTISMALRRMGYSGDVMTGHGFRTTASTRLNEMGVNSDYIERQLAHVDRNQVRAAYNRASYLTERREMMQMWADYLDDLRVKARETATQT